MKTDEKITLWSERIHEFQFSGQTCKTWCQEHHVPVSTMNYWMRKLKKLDEQSDTDMIFAKMPTEKEISKNETLNISPSPVRIFISSVPCPKKTCRPSGGTFYFFFLVRNPSGNSFDHGKSRFRSSGFGKGPILRSSSNT